MLLEMKDGGILNIAEDKYSNSGCETCGYGSRYVNNFYIKLTNISIDIEASQSYEYPLSEGHMMLILLPNVDKIKEMTEQEFVKWIEEKLKAIHDKIIVKAKTK